jgi:putative transposase
MLAMPRRGRCVLPEVPCHITQRGVDRRETFSADEDRYTYLRLLRENLSDADVRVLAWCLMTNHLHLVAVPGREDSLNVLLRRVHGRYAQYYNARWGRTGHLWQNRFFACVLGPGHLWAALAYVERNPVRAGMVKQAAEYRWSSAAAHLSGKDEHGLLDMTWWRREGPEDWCRILGDEEREETTDRLRACTYAGRPFGDETFVNEMGTRFGRQWTRGRPKKKGKAEISAAEQANQFALF